MTSNISILLYMRGLLAFTQTSDLTMKLPVM